MLLQAASVIMLAVALVESMPPLKSHYTYMVLVPRNIRPGSNSTIKVHFAKSVSGETTTAKLIQTKRSPDRKVTEVILAEVTVAVPNGETDADIQLPIPFNMSWGSYSVNVSATGSVQFHNSTSVFLRGRKTIALFVQTDKAMYKPGDTVQYRVFAVDSKLSLVDPLMDIELQDPKGNKIDEHTGIKDIYGFEGSLPLSTMPPLGQWKIVVHAIESDETENYYFDVKEYVLPKFEVTVELAPFGKMSDTSLKGTATATYTFGDPVGGIVVLTISKQYGSSFFIAKAIRRELTLVNGKASFDITMDLLREITRGFDYETFVVHANVTETITGQTLAGQGQIRYYSNPYKIEFFPNMPDNFKPGFGPYEVWVKVLQQDGSPPELKPGDAKTIKVTVTYFTDEKVIGTIANRKTFENYTLVCPFIDGEVILKETKTYPIANDGTVKFNLQIPEKTATMAIKAQYAGVDSYKDVRRFRSPTDTFFKSEILNDVNVKPLKIGDFVSIKVYSTIGLVTAKWLVISRGQIIKSGDVPITSGTPSSGVVQFLLTREMVPTARFVVYHVKQDDEVLADGLNFFVDDIFENKVTIKFAQPSPQKPKALVDLEVTADTDSLVKVLSVDKSVKLLADGNDITPERVTDEMNQFGDSPRILRGWGPVLPWSFNSDDVHDIFENAQIKVLSDAYLYRFDLWRLSQVVTRNSPRNAFFGESKMAGGFGGTAGPSAVGQIRKDFPETWIWESAVASGGTAIFSKVKVPDTITEFTANVFALNLKTGLGVAPTTANLTVLLPLFVKIQLPYSVIRNEVAVIQANIFNKLDQDHNVLVTLKRSDDFVGITVGPYNTVIEEIGDITKCVLVKKGQPTPVYFNIKPKKVKKDMTLIIRADVSKPIARFDEVHHELIVKAEGIQKEKNTPILVSFKTNSNVVETRNLVYPQELVPDSEFTRVTVFGDLFGASLENIDKLIRMPYGCGEQNMVNFAPAVFAAAYMRKTGRFDTNTNLKNKIKKVLMTGYQRQLIYQRRDGSFSAFGDADKEGSLWLTAFVIKSFAQAHPLGIIFIDHKVIERAVEFVIKNQNPDGTLINVGITSHKALKGGASGDRAMLAYVLLALKEVKEAGIIKDVATIGKLNNSILLLTNALVLKVPQMTTDYEKAIGAYALKLVGSPASTTLLAGLESSTNKVVKGNKKYWKNPSHAIEIEIASYGLLTYSKMADTTNGLMILKWLISNRNSYGGFSSTQDTVVALQALSEFAGLIYSKDVSMTIDICKNTCAVPANKKRITLNNQNHDILQFVEFEGNVGKIVVEVSGIGLALIDINQFYNVISETSNAYDLTVTSSDETAKKYTIKACARFKIPNASSNMAIMDFGSVSGFEPIKDKVVKTAIMKRLELEGGRLVIYFDEIPQKQVCVSVPFQRVSIVSGVKPATFLVYSYYEPNEKLMKSYLPPILDDKKMSLCKACDYVCCKTDNLLETSQC